MGKVKVPVVSDSLQPCGLSTPWNSPGQNTGLGDLSLLPGIFPIQELNQGLLHCIWIFYQLSYQGIKATEKEERFQCISKIRCEFQ